MVLANMTSMLRRARERGYAVGAFNMVDYASARAIVEAAAETAAPVIVQTSGKTVQFWGAPAIAGWLRELATRVPVPVALHLDHCKDLALIRECIDAGWTSVMIDASAHPFDENLALTRQVLALARPAGVSVEAELGEIGGVEDDKAVDDAAARLADPAKAIRFCREAPVDCLAPAIGTAHGVYRGEPRLDLERLATIAQGTPTPLALHGGTGLGDEVFHECIRRGCAKINISTQIKYAFIDGFRDYYAAHPGDYEPVKGLAAQLARLRREVAEKIACFGAAGRAEGAHD